MNHDNHIAQTCKHYIFSEKEKVVLSLLDSYHFYSYYILSVFIHPRVILIEWVWQKIDSSCFFFFFLMCNETILISFKIK